MALLSIILLCMYLVCQLKRGQLTDCDVYGMPWMALLPLWRSVQPSRFLFFLMSLLYQPLSWDVYSVSQLPATSDWRQNNQRNRVIKRVYITYIY